MKSLNNYLHINEKLTLNKQSKIGVVDEIIELVLNDFEKRSWEFKDDKNNKELINQIKKWISECVQKYNYNIKDFNNHFNWDAPDPLDDYEVDWIYHSKNGNDYTFISGPQILGFLSYYNYYYRFSK